MNIEHFKEQNMTFLDTHLGESPIERLQGAEIPLFQSGIAIVSREVEVQPEIDVSEPWLDDRSTQPLTRYYVEVLHDSKPLVSVESLMPAPEQDEVMRANVYELLASDETAIETLKHHLEMPRYSQNTRPRFN